MAPPSRCRHAHFLISSTCWTVPPTKLWPNPAGAAGNYRYFCCSTEISCLFSSAALTWRARANLAGGLVRGPQRGLAARLIGNGNNWPLGSISLMGWIGNQSYCLFGKRPSNPWTDASLPDESSLLNSASAVRKHPDVEQNRDFSTDVSYYRSDQTFVHERIKLADLSRKSWIIWGTNALNCF